MREIPMLFSPPMVTAILDNRKNQTRRLSFSGSVGDVLWVRETYFDYGYWNVDVVVKDGEKKIKKTFVSLRSEEHPVIFKGNPPTILRQGLAKHNGYYKRSALFMDKGACRIKLEVTEVKQETLLSISREDCHGEGIEWKFRNGAYFYRDYITGLEIENNPMESYLSLWKKLNGSDAIDNNQTISVIKFKRI